MPLVTKMYEFIYILYRALFVFYLSIHVSKDTLQKQQSKKPVYELDDAGFDDFISRGYHFIKFYAPWYSFKDFIRLLA